MRLKDKVAIITGSGRGIGKATALRFAKEGAKVVVDDVNEERGKKTVEEIKAANGTASFITADVSKEKDVELMVKQAISNFGKLDILVNNAICDTASVVNNVWAPNIDVCLKGTYLCSMAAIPEMIKAGGGSIINIASVNALIGLQGIHAYSAAKGGIISITRSMAVAHGKDKIRVNVICPGTIQTEVWEPILKEKPHIHEEIAEWYPIGRIGKPEDIANAALFLASDEASFATGAIFVIDGGLTAGIKGFPI
jgi:NAD(P)-dependent dehydrogenase (short-subunit alcohol dehydrogenase family)